VEIEYDEEAIAEAMEAAAWYESRSEGLSLRFLAKWKQAETRMVSDPMINHVFGDGFRRCRFEVFPYALVYRVRGESVIQVLAVMHQKRHPGYWKSRLDV
jgi:plasmid stabilization system protein ParE